MVEEFVSYMLRASVYLLVLAVVYQLFFSHRVHAAFNRKFLLSVILFAIFAPQLAEWNVGREEALHLPLVEFPEFVVTAGNVYQGANSDISAAISGAGKWLWVFPVGSLFVLMFTLFQLIRLAILWFKPGSIQLQGLRVVQTNKETAPFSFFSMLVVPSDLMNEADFEAVLQHEMAHFEKRHSVDLLLFEFLKALFWFHPAFYYLKHELRKMHEYQADALAVSRMKKSIYQNALLQFSFSLNVIPISNPFNVSLLKKRLLMMNQEGDQPTRNRLKMFVLVPILAVFVFVQSCHSGKMEESTDDLPETIEQLVEVSSMEATAQPPADEIFTVVEEIPFFPGGTEAMMQFLKDNLRYPEKAKANNIEGTVYINFIVEADGKVSNAKVLRGIGHGCDEEALRVISIMPVWQAGKQRGQAVSVSFNIPVKFALN